MLLVKKNPTATATPKQEELKKAVISIEIPKHSKIKKAIAMLTMQEAMNYLSDKGVPCKSRATFYRILKDFKVPYVNVNPNGKHEVRRFTADGLNKVLKANGLNPL